MVVGSAYSRKLLVFVARGEFISQLQRVGVVLELF
jgi:hypothetical protein